MLTRRHLLLAAGVLVGLLLVAGAASLGHHLGERRARDATLRALERVRDVEAQLRELETLTSSAAAARARAEERVRVAEALMESAEAERDHVLAEVRRPVAAPERARRVRRALALAAPDAASTSSTAVTPLPDGSFRVSAPAMQELELALRLRPILELQLAALQVAHDAQRDRAIAALTEVMLVRQERDVLRIAWTTTEAELAEARAGRGPPEWALYAGAGAAVVAVIGAFAAGRATAGGGVTVVR